MSTGPIPLWLTVASVPQPPGKVVSATVSPLVHSVVHTRPVLPTLAAALRLRRCPEWSFSCHEDY